MLKNLTLLMFLVVLALAGGCNPVVASSEFSITMNSNAISAKVVLDDQSAGTLTPEEARDYIPRAACVLETYYKSATVNPFTHYFSDGKPLLVTAKWFNLIRRASLQATVAGTRAGKCSDPNAIIFARAMANEIRKIDLARQGDDE